MTATGRMHSATLAGSPQRLQVLLAFLDRCGARGATAKEIRVGTGSQIEAVSAAITELRANGVAIPWSLPEDRGGRRKQYVYRLAKYAPAPADPVDGPLRQGKLFGETG